MLLYDLSEFYRLSSALNYNLSAASINRYNVMMFIIDGKKLHRDEKKDREAKGIMMEAINYLFNAYAEKRRRLGPLAVLHPLRATAMLARAKDQPVLADLVALLFHDVLEDIRSGDFDSIRWRQLESQFYDLMARMNPVDENEVTNRMIHLTIRRDESYYEYIGRLLDNTIRFPDLVHTKLADRLDNTLDMRIELKDPLEDINFFMNIFQLMFIGKYNMHSPFMLHPTTVALNGARRLFQLFKNAVLLSLIRVKKALNGNKAGEQLFNALAEASLKEAQRNFLHVAGHHCKELPLQRELVLDVMQYCHMGRTEMVTLPDMEHPLDGLFSTFFSHTSRQQRERKLDDLYENKPLMLQSSLGFIVIFLNFLNDPDFYVKGISTQGIRPEQTV